MICIENTSKQKKVWTLSALNKVTLETFVESKVQQLWKQGEPDAEGFITLEKSTVEESKSVPVQCTPDLVTHLVSQKNVTKSRGVTK